MTDATLRRPHRGAGWVVVMVVSRAIESGCLFLLTGLAALRPLVSESYDTAAGPFTGVLEAIRDPSPLRTLGFDCLILLAALGCAVARAIGPALPRRRTGLGWGAALVTIAAIGSCLFAGNKRLAITATIDWLCYPLLAMALAALLTESWHRRLLVSVIVASCVAQAFQCYSQRWWEFADTEKQYEEIKADLWARQGVEPDSPQVALYEARLRAREASGFLSHSNVAASHLTLGVFAALGVVVGWWQRRRPRSDPLTVGGPAAAVGGGRHTGTAALLAMAAAVVIASAIPGTGSNGAMISVAGVGLIWLAVSLGRAGVVRERRRIFVQGWRAVATIIVAIVACGLATDALPTWSLTFRWQYWRASFSMIVDHLLTGVGRENFGRHYLAYKPITAPEEVANPHNLLVQPAADWGVVGLLGLILMLVGVSSLLTLSSPERNAKRPTSTGPHWFRLAGWTLALVTVVTVVRGRLLGTDNPDYVYYQTVTTGMAWLLGFAAIAGPALLGDFGDHRFERAMVAGATAGVVAFLVHDMINFALFVPATAHTFFSLLAVSVAGGPEAQSTPSPGANRWRRWAAPSTLGLAGVAVVLLGVVPVARTRPLLERARSSPAPDPARPLEAHAAFVYYTTAARADPLDPTPLTELSKWLFLAAKQPTHRDDALGLVHRTLTAAIERDPQNVSLRRMRVRTLRFEGQFRRSVDVYTRAIDAACDVLKIYVNSPEDYVVVADTAYDAWEATSHLPWAEMARGYYFRALALDDSRWAGEKHRRFSPDERDRIRNQAGNVKGAIFYGG